MIYDEATINFIMKKILELREQTWYENDGRLVYENVLKLLENIKKIKAIN